ncbi:hypothetical protein [Hymenobacter glacialis]|uniref:Ig-like domain-containing protein n=1 Tax=Hymenobacter glacialis TaxID=1908236 RepID=A0A1G1T1Z9_9BACT|nr:hypothetical protein [Hymenobacter glacialis]OGX84877.1 hypothetical protein BEN48_15500 [Hymenobacter glacialis]
MKIYPLVLLAALLGLSQCHKKSDPTPPPQNPVSLLPPETQTGQRTFGCLLNGQPWTQAGSPFNGPVLAAEWYQNRLSISCRRAINNANGSPHTNQSIEFAIDPVAGPGNYQLKDSKQNLLVFSDFLTNCQYLTGSGQVATVQITRWDPVARIVSGRFAFTLETPGCGRVTVSEGRFDTRF